jgi:hypothetical protein
MLGSSVSQFRVLVLLLAFALGLAGQAVSNFAMAAQMQGPTQAGICAGTPCPDCDGDMQHGGLAPGCMSSSCWNIPGLPAQGTALEPHVAAVFPVSADAIVAGIASAPDPHPPRTFLHS